MTSHMTRYNAVQAETSKRLSSTRPACHMHSFSQGQWARSSYRTFLALDGLSYTTTKGPSCSWRYMLAVTPSVSQDTQRMCLLYLNLLYQHTHICTSFDRSCEYTFNAPTAGMHLHLYLGAVHDGPVSLPWDSSLLIEWAAAPPVSCISLIYKALYI